MSHDAIDRVVVRAGRRRRRELKALARGEGDLADVVGDAIDDAIAGAADVDRDQVLPVIIVYEERPKKRRRRVGLLGF